jgi:hypothetical protein
MSAFTPRFTRGARPCRRQAVRFAAAAQRIVNEILERRTLFAAGGTDFAITDQSLVEGNSGTSTMVFTVTRSGDLSGSSDVVFTTADGSALAGQDYTPQAGVVHFDPLQTTATIHVPILGDTLDEADEKFSVSLVGLPGTGPAFNGTTFGTGALPHTAALADAATAGRT